MTKSLAKLKSIIFDLDQTLIDWRRGKEACINASAQAMVDAGLRLPVENTKKRINEIYKRKGYEYQRVFDDLLNSLNVNLNDRIKIKAAGVVAYKEAKREHLVVYPDIPFALEELKEMGYILALISDAPPFQGWTRLFELGLVKYFQDDHIYIGKGTKISKKPFKILMEEHNYSPHELLMVGDDPKRDIKPANELGIVTALTKYGQVFPIDKKDPLQKPDYILHSLWELIDLLKEAK